LSDEEASCLHMTEDPELREPDPPRTGWSTGSCASAAAKAATLLLHGEDLPGYVEIALPSGDRVTFKVEEMAVDGDRDRARAVVIKDAGDDPDVPHGAHITADVSWLDGPGLELDGPATNPVPREMIAHAVAEALADGALEEPPEAESLAEPGGGRGVRVVISVPDGEVTARETTDKRPGTTGIVRPFSTASWRVGVEQAVSLMAAQDETTLVLCTGGRTEKGAMKMLPKLPDVCFVEVGDFTGAALRKAVEYGLKQVSVVGMAGKLTKLAAGVLTTHYTRSKVNTGLLGEITTDMGGSAELAAEVAAANTARHAYELWEAAGVLGPCGRELCRRVGLVLERFAAETAEAETSPIAAQVVLVDFTGERMVAMAGRLAR
jgi:cobalt-precorrin-5B (C1)-methyltransferase